MLEAKACYRALAAKDARFDGLFFVGVRTTGIYCRPICRARTPRADRCRFFRTAAEAEREGFRACFRCRPERAPGVARSDASSRLVREAVSRIEAGALNEGSVDDLAGVLGVGARHLRRITQTELGISPIELAEARRLALAKQLVTSSSLSMIDVALASGFRSLRRFNALFKLRFARTPSEERRAGAHGAFTEDRGAPAAGRDEIALTLDYRPPFDWRGLTEFFARRACRGVEHVDPDAISRTIRVAGREGWVRIEPLRGCNSLRAEIASTLAGSLMVVVAGLRRWLDLDARPREVAAALARDRLVGRHVRRRPGLRLPGAIDRFELAVRAVLGQRVSVAAARALADRFVTAFGEPIVTPYRELDRLFPSASRIACTSPRAIAALGILPARATTMVALAKLADRVELTDDGWLAELRAIDGIGVWTAEYVAMRALGWPDALPTGDRALCRTTGLSPRELEARAESWRPWRSYAVMQLWSASASERKRS